MSCSSEAGGFAMCLLLHSHLRGRKRTPLASWAKVLPMARGHAVIETHLRQHSFEVFNVHARRKWLVAKGADRARLAFARALIQLHSKLRGALKNVEELAKWQIQQSSNHRDCVSDSDEIVEAAAQPFLGNR